MKPVRTSSGRDDVVKLRAFIGIAVYHACTTRACGIASNCALDAGKKNAGTMAVDPARIAYAFTNDPTTYASRIPGSDESVSYPHAGRGGPAEKRASGYAFVTVARTAEHVTVVEANLTVPVHEPATVHAHDRTYARPFPVCRVYVPAGAMLYPTFSIVVARDVSVGSESSTITRTLADRVKMAPLSTYPS